MTVDPLLTMGGQRRSLASSFFLQIKPSPGALVSARARACPTRCTRLVPATCCLFSQQRTERMDSTDHHHEPSAFTLRCEQAPSAARASLARACTYRTDPVSAPEDLSPTVRHARPGRRRFPLTSTGSAMLIAAHSLRAEPAGPPSRQVVRSIWARIFLRPPISASVQPSAEPPFRSGSQAPRLAALARLPPFVSQSRAWLLHG